MNPLDAIKKEVEEIKHDISVAVETTLQEGIAKVAISRLIALHPNTENYQIALKALD